MNTYKQKHNKQQQRLNFIFDWASILIYINSNTYHIQIVWNSKTTHTHLLKHSNNYNCNIQWIVGPVLTICYRGSWGCAGTNGPMRPPLVLGCCIAIIIQQQRRQQTISKSHVNLLNVRVCYNLHWKERVGQTLRARNHPVQIINMQTVKASKGITAVWTQELHWIQTNHQALSWAFVLMTDSN